MFISAVCECTRVRAHVPPHNEYVVHCYNGFCTATPKDRNKQTQQQHQQRGRPRTPAGVRGFLRTSAAVRALIWVFVCVGARDLFVVCVCLFVCLFVCVCQVVCLPVCLFVVCGFVVCSFLCFLRTGGSINQSVCHCSICVT